jgi:hypothetical protein
LDIAHHPGGNHAGVEGNHAAVGESVAKGRVGHFRVHPPGVDLQECPASVVGEGAAGSGAEEMALGVLLLALAGVCLMPHAAGSGAEEMALGEFPSVEGGDGDGVGYEGAEWFDKV